MFRVVLGLLIPITLTLAAGPASAEAESELNRAGFYLQLGGVLALNNFDSSVTDDPFPPFGAPANPFGGGITGAVGYRFNGWYALDVEYLWARMTDEVSTAIPGGFSNRSLEVESWTMMVNGRLYPFADVDGRFQPYLKLGLGYMRTQTRNVDETVACTPGCVVVSRPKFDNTEGGFGLKIGLGADLYLNPRFYLYTDYAYNNGVSNVIELYDFHTFSWGGGYRW